MTHRVLRQAVPQRRLYVVERELVVGARPRVGVWHRLSVWHVLFFGLVLCALGLAVWVITS